MESDDNDDNAEDYCNEETAVGHLLPSGQEKEFAGRNLCYCITISGPLAYPREPWGFRRGRDPLDFDRLGSLPKRQA